MKTYSISETSKQTGLSIDTLRYYERIDLLVDIDRNGSGHRAYNDDDLGWLGWLACLRETGMPIADMVCFAELVRQGDESMDDRLALLNAHRDSVLSKIDQMQQRLAVIDKKIEYYSNQ